MSEPNSPRDLNEEEMETPHREDGVEKGDGKGEEKAKESGEGHGEGAGKEEVIAVEG